ncbi:heterokaryon incompatibility protein-domain-containing protein [Dactylonectria estremocensis]|uniref:Heterokaryon incompatibility protein-domain-containing protein n=1 Tax=Dactylonectria estremocensis TaxID=1079267 RepID=A0A9P9F8R0_9HYPO|nr:heterokaryon incompatibility protein-domain-containing protein [Dactylonectria estremocensis]
MSQVYQPYAHRKLDAATSIRLARVMPDLIDGCVACEIRHFDLPELNKIEFKALSYLWGDPKPTRRIYLTDVDTRGEWCQFSIHENLWRFLHHVWRQKLPHQHWWTDCICLHQKDSNEMSQQIPRMGEIYSSAQEVAIWLDLPEWVEQKVQGLRDRTNVGSFSFESRRGYLPAGMEKVTHSVANDEYWRRVWILQEVVLAKRATIMMKTIPPFKFEEFREHVGSFFVDPSAPDINKLYNLCNRKKHPLWEILRGFDSYESTKPNDRLYGLLGLVANNVDGTSPVDHIHVDYDKPLCDVMLDAVFESQPPLYLYEGVAKVLLDYTECNIDVLELYRDDNKTSKRHSELADVTLQVFDAMHMIMNALHTLHSGWCLRHAYRNLFPSLEHKEFVPTQLDRAVFIGVTLAFGVGGENSALLDENWEKLRRPRLKGSPWRCEHHKDAAGTGSISNADGWDADLYDAPWDLESIAKACGNENADVQSCDGSCMTFELPNIGFRMVIETGEREWSSGRLRVFFQDGLLHLKGAI